MSDTQPSRGDDLLALETISELRDRIEVLGLDQWCEKCGFVDANHKCEAFKCQEKLRPTARRALSLVDRLAFLLSEASARGLPPISETSEGGESTSAHLPKACEAVVNAGQQSDPSAPATPAPAGDEATPGGNFIFAIYFRYIGTAQWMMQESSECESDVRHWLVRNREQNAKTFEPGAGREYIMVRKITSFERIA